MYLDDPWVKNTIRHQNDYYLEKYNRWYDSVAIPKDEFKHRLEELGYETYDGGLGSVGYRGFGRSGVIFGLTPDILEDMKLQARKHLESQQEPIVLRDTWKEIFNWFKRG